MFPNWRPHNRPVNFVGFRHYGNAKFSTETSTSTSLSHDINYNDTTHYTPLFLAVHNGKLEIAHSLLTEEASVHKELAGRTLIHVAAARGHEQIICLLCKRNADVYKEDKDGNTPLHLAVKGSHIDVVNMLSNEFTANLKNYCEQTPLHIATEKGHIQLVEILLKNGARVDERDAHGRSSLHIAVKKRYPEMQIIMLFLTHGALVNSSCNKGFIPLHHAAALGNVQIIEVLINHGASINEKNNDGVSPLTLAIDKNKTEVAKAILSKGAIIDYEVPDSTTLLHMAAQNGNAEIVKLLVSKEDVNKINAINEDFKTALHLCAANGHAEVLKYLIECDAKIDPKTRDGETPLHLAAAAGHLEIVSELLSRGADIDSTTEEEFTPLTLAVKTRKIEVVSLLLTKGAKVKVGGESLSGIYCRDQSPLSSFHVAARIGDEKILKIFLEKGIKVDLTSKDDKTALHIAATFGHKKSVEELIKAGACIDSRTRFKETPLHLAAASGRSSIVRYLLNAGAAVQSQTTMGFTPLHYVLDRERHTEIINFTKPPARISRRFPSLSSSCGDDTSTEWLVSPLLFEKYLEITEMLLVKGASAFTPTRQGETPLDFASQIRVYKKNQPSYSSNPNVEGNASMLKYKNTSQQYDTKGEFRPEIVRCLLNYGAERNVNYLKTALKKNFKVKCPTLIDLLSEYDVNKSFSNKDTLNIALMEDNSKCFLAVADHIDDIDTLLDSLYTYNNNSLRLLKVAALVKMRSISQGVGVPQDREIKFLESKNLLDWYTQCELQIIRMREAKIHQQFDITFYDILTKPTSKLANYARNEDLMRTLERNSCKKFPAYAQFLERSIAKGKERKALMESSEDSFFNLIRRHHKIELPSLVVDKILGYLTVIELRKLSSALEKTYLEKVYKKPAYGFLAGKRN